MTQQTVYRLVASLAFINGVLAVVEIILHRAAWVVCLNAVASVSGFWCARHFLKQYERKPEVPPPEIDPRDSPYYVG